ncbi:MAG: SUMF1/EgtB/PvdO family nonheme iron enzyme, partial [Pseudonocardia sp.]|nr:SUMF1/EgtB/PvdO family nonheme iron enzyme [Pseudonocardia sp.]
NLAWGAGGAGEVAANAPGYWGLGLHDMLGNVWEWTASTFRPYPNFEQDAYRDNSWPWFAEGRKVLRGGAWPTRARYVRTGFRNYFTPERRDVIAGFRTCRA